VPARVFTINQLKDLTGQEVGVSEWLQITQEMIDRFAELTQDDQWIHVDPERARTESQFGTTIAHGFLTLSLLSHLSHQAVEIQGDFRMRINYGLNRVRFVSPVPAGARICAHLTPQQVTDNGLIWAVTVELEGSSKPALVAEWVTRFY
jgi:acyl dehydratase